MIDLWESVDYNFEEWFPFISFETSLEVKWNFFVIYLSWLNII